MKKTAILTLAAALLLTGCNSSETNGGFGGNPYVGDNSSAASGTTAGTTSGTAPKETTGTTTAGTTAATTAGTTAATTAGTTAATTAGTTVATTTGTTPATTTAVHAEPSESEYKPTDIGGREESGLKSESGMGGGIFDGLFAEDAAAEIMADGAPSAHAGAVGEPYGGAAITEPIEPLEYEQRIPPAAGLLTGGEWRDNDNWEFWQGLYGSNNYYGADWDSYKEAWRTNVDFRVAVTVKDSEGKPVAGARVTSDKPYYSAVTDNKGRAYLFYSYSLCVNGFSDITVTYGDISKTESMIIGTDSTLEITLEETAQPKAKTLDFMIMCDTTGSMMDELDYIKEELGDVVTRIKNENANIPTRISVNFYRDVGDEYVVRAFPFTEELSLAVNSVAEQTADGGGDFPEAVHTALDNAINEHEWREDSVKIMFLVLDAPPHVEDVQIVDEVAKLTRQAAEKGIRIIPVTASGIDKSTEYLMRSIAFMTGGTYCFLTNDSGIGGDHIEPTIGSYDVEKLNDMMVRITGEYLN